MTTETIPHGFWNQIDHQLDRIESEKPDTFAKVRAILLDPAYARIMDDVHLDGPRRFADDAAFFAGSGGDRSLFSALYAAGWRRTWVDAVYFWTARHEATGAVLTYCEGDVYEGER